MKCYAGRTVAEQKLYNYCNNKKQDAKRYATNWSLTNEQVEHLLAEAGITIMDVGKSNDKYHLARHNDTGDYEFGNCRFITALENRQEQDHYKQWSAPGNEASRKKAGETGARTWKIFIKENPERHKEISKMGAKAVKEMWSRKCK